MHLRPGVWREQDHVRQVAGGSGEVEPSGTEAVEVRHVGQGMAVLVNDRDQVGRGVDQRHLQGAEVGAVQRDGVHASGQPAALTQRETRFSLKHVDDDFFVVEPTVPVDVVGRIVEEWVGDLEQRLIALRLRRGQKLRLRPRVVHLHYAVLRRPLVLRGREDEQVVERQPSEEVADAREGGAGEAGAKVALGDRRGVEVARVVDIVPADVDHEEGPVSLTTRATEQRPVHVCGAGVGEVVRRRGVCRRRGWRGEAEGDKKDHEEDAGSAHDRP